MGQLIAAPRLANLRTWELIPAEPPNMRLKLSGGDRFKGSGVFVPWRARTFVHFSCPNRRVARSLSAIR